METTDDEQLQQQQEEVELDETLDAENGEDESQKCSENAEQTCLEKNVRQTPQQPDAEQKKITSKSETVNSETEYPSQTQENAQQAERPTSGQQTVHVQLHSKTSTPPEKKQQVAIVHAHERSHPTPDDGQLSRVLDDGGQRSSVSRQPTVESYLSIESASSHQLSQASLLWQTDQLQVGGAGGGIRRQDRLQQAASLQQQYYDQLRYQLQEQLELQRSQLEREYQLREEQMKQQMMQLQYITHQQQQQQQQCRTSTQRYSDVRQDSAADTRRCNAASCCNFPPSQSPGCTCHPAASLQQRVQQAHCAERQLYRDAITHVAARTRQRSDREARPMVVDVMSRSRGRGGRQSAWPSHAGGGAHCRIVVGDTEYRANWNRDRGRDASDDEDEECVGQTGGGRPGSSGPAARRRCPTCGLCRPEYDASDGKNNKPRHCATVRRAGHITA